MARPKQARNWIFSVDLWATIAAMALALLMIVLATQLHAQTLTVLHNFTGGSDGSHPQAGMALDQHGVFYGTSQYGGYENCDNGGVQGCGVLFKFKNTGSGWVLTPLHDFHDGSWPVGANVPAVGPNGTLYGITFLGGDDSGGLVYNASPMPSVPASGISFWNYNPIYEFTGNNDGGNPPRISPVIFGAAGNFYGVAGGGLYGKGVIYEMTPSGNGWTESVIYAFTGGSDGSYPEGIVFDDEGTMYGTAHNGGNQECYRGYGCGTIFKLTPSAGGWTETTLYVFRQGIDGAGPGPLMRDHAGNLYGLTYDKGSELGGTVWELSPSNGGWAFSVLHSFSTVTVGDYGPYAPAMDAAGNLYGITNWGGANNYGFLFELSPANGDSWTYTDLHDFGSWPDLGDGCFPQGAPVLDAEGNIYDTTEDCGRFGAGNIWEFTP